MRRVVIAALGVTQTLSWGSTYYLPAIFADPVSDELRLSHSWFFGSFGIALLLSGLLGPAAGRVIDRHGGRDVLVASNVAIAAGLAFLSSATGPVSLAAAWLVIGAGMGYGLYEAAFATIVRLYGPGARTAITGVTLFAGFASTVAWPLSAYLIDALGWRGACLTWAVLHLLVGVPLNRLLVPRAVPAGTGTDAPASDAKGADWRMGVLACVFAATWFVATGFSAHMPRILEALGASPSAAIAAGACIGPAQVAARAAELMLMRRMSPMTSARLAAALHPLGALALAAMGPAAAIAFAILHGAGNGLLTIARGTLPLALFGAAGYGLRTGLLAAPARILQGGAPLVFGVVLDDGGPVHTLALSGAMMSLALLALTILRIPSNNGK